MCPGSEFQMEEAAAGKARLPTVDSLTDFGLVLGVRLFVPCCHHCCHHIWCACVEDCNILLMQKVDDTTFFDRTWDEFKAGFGDVGLNYWLGNEQIHQLTKNATHKLRVGVEAELGIYVKTRSR